MNIFSRYSKYPWGPKYKKYLGTFISHKKKQEIFKSYEETINDFSELVHKRYIPNYCLGSGSRYLFLAGKQIPNILFKTLVLQEVSREAQRKVVLDCYAEELNYFDNEKNVNRFACIYALIAGELPSLLNVRNIGN